MGRWGRKPSCECGGCPKCLDRAAARARWQALTIEERRERISRRNRQRVQADDRRRHQQNLQDPDYVAKRHARQEVNKAIRRGDLDRGPCEVCGNPDAHAHHDDYTRPLDIRWLCTVHHAAEHVQAEAA